MGKHEIKAEAFGFQALSEEYTPESPEEKGDPDLKIASVEIYIEVTGPDKAIGIKDDLWIRWDKFIYAENHPEKEIWVAHILESSGDLIRFLKLGPGVKEKYKVTTPIIRGTKETFRSIPANDKDLFTLDKFCLLIKGK